MQNLRGALSLVLALAVSPAVACGDDDGTPVDGSVTDARTTDATVTDAPTADAAASLEGVDDDDMELYRLINAYRVENGLPELPLSPSLSLVARTHVMDSRQNMPDQGECNLHSWSNEGSWGGCCYTSDHAEAQCMWDKPRELTAYPGNGYEISARGSGSAEGMLNLWKGSPGHNNVILNAGSWTQPWGAIGVAMDAGGYSHVWFGHEADPAL